MHLSLPPILCTLLGASRNKEEGKQGGSPRMITVDLPTEIGHQNRLRNAEECNLKVGAKFAL